MSSKYSKDGPFSDPVVRCEKCRALVFVTDLSAVGKCPNIDPQGNACGNRRVGNVQSLSGTELEHLRQKGVDPEYLALWHEVTIPSEAS